MLDLLPDINKKEYSLLKILDGCLVIYSMVVICWYNDILTSNVQWIPCWLMGINIFETAVKLCPDHNKRVLDPCLAMVAKVASAAKTSNSRVNFHKAASTT